MKKIIAVLFFAILLLSTVFIVFRIYTKQNEIIIKDLSPSKESFILYIKADNKKIILDSGLEYKHFLEAVKKVNLDINDPDYILISHADGDHVFGFLHPKDNPLPDYRKVIINQNIYQDMLRLYPKRKKFIEKFKDSFHPVDDYKITKNIIYTKAFLGDKWYGWEKGKIYESFLIIKTRKGIIIVAACSHPKIYNFVQYAKKLTKTDKIYAIIGGFDELNEKDLEYLNNTKARIYPIHCTRFISPDLKFEKSFELPFVLR